MPYALVIDDNRQTAEALVRILKIWDIPAKILLNPGSVEIPVGEEIPKIVFLDVNMPHVSGLDVLDYIKKNPKLHQVPVVIVTSDDQVETGRRALDSGATTILIKPVMPDLIENALMKAGILTKPGN